MFTVIIFLIVLAVLIFVHELGHFLAARSAGIRVDAFKIGFGPRIFYWKRGETEYGINLIPFGGFVKIHGENPDQDAVDGPDAARSFVNKSRPKQVMVLVAGVFFNFLFAWLLYSVAFMSGVIAPYDGFGKYADRFSDERVMVTGVDKGGPADLAGFEEGDVIRRVTKPASVSSSDVVISATTTSIGFAGKVNVSDIQEMVSSSGGRLLRFDIERADATSTIAVNAVAGLRDDNEVYAIGIAMHEVADLRLPFFTSIGEGFRYTLIMIRETVKGLALFIGNIFQGTANFADVAGPVGIAGIVGDAANLGFTYLIMITALISINLGVINLIPFPALDGGRTLFVIIEGVIRRRISMKFTNAVNAVGFILLMLLMVVVTYKDIAKMFK